mgnify:CR=1 FL=1
MNHLPLRLDCVDADGLKREVRHAWALTDWLFSRVADDAMRLNPDPLRNPLVFYLGHPAAFWLNKLKLAGVISSGLDERLEARLAVGVDPATVSELDLSTHYPPIDEVRDFRRQALEVVLQACERCGTLAWDSPGWAFPMALEHERIHVETSSVLLRQAPLALVQPPEGWELAPAGTAPPNGRVALAGGMVTLGKPELPTFGWDNEYGQKTVEVAPFSVSRQLVSNAEYALFVNDAYTDDRWWSAEGAAWRGSRTAPAFWRGPRLRTVFQEIERPEDWPAVVTWFEAEAFCNWTGARMPTEAEQAHLALDAPRRDGDAAFHPAHHLHLATCSPRGVATGLPTERGVHDPYGNVWQWLSDDFQPLPGFRAHRLYEDFSKPWFGEQHKMLLGGSWASTGATASQFYRLWFRPGFLQHAGFRMAW